MPEKWTSVGIPASLHVRLKEIQNRMLRDTNIQPTLPEIIEHALDVTENRETFDFLITDSR